MKHAHHIETPPPPGRDPGMAIWILNVQSALLCYLSGKSPSTDLIAAIKLYAPGVAALTRLAIYIHPDFVYPQATIERGGGDDER